MMKNALCTDMARPVALGLLLLPLLAGLAGAANPVKTITGLSVVQDTGEMVIDGQKIILWGIDTLAPDQQCWQGDMAWGCGESSIIALRHFVEGRSVTCEIQHYADEESNVAVAKCFRPKGSGRQDIAARMVEQGWATERGSTSGGAYYEEEQEAQEFKRGVWSGRFQSAQDWRDGVQRYFGDTPKQGPFIEQPKPQQ
ncbi:MAG: hypothetical protein PHW63_02920 [Alphaproteobacteria bacterium]|nr:hypothetical protein [Alphaproteobacteria bacterium]